MKLTKIVEDPLIICLLFKEASLNSFYCAKKIRKHILFAWGFIYPKRYNILEYSELQV